MRTQQILALALVVPSFAFASCGPEPSAAPGMEIVEIEPDVVTDPDTLKFLALVEQVKIGSTRADVEALLGPRHSSLRKGFPPVCDNYQYTVDGNVRYAQIGYNDKTGLVTLARAGLPTPCAII